MLLRSNSVKYLNVPPIEIKNECGLNKSDSTLCKRKFDVSSYSDQIGFQFDNIPRSQTLVGKLSGLTPEILRYSIELRDESFTKLWRGQNSETKTDIPPGNCPYPDDFIKTERGGIFENPVDLSEISIRLGELATALNDCKQWIWILPNDVDDFERTEKYQAIIKLSVLSHLTLLILALLFTVFILKIYESLYKFIKS